MNKPALGPFNNASKDGSQTPVIDSASKDNMANGVNSSNTAVGPAPTTPATPALATPASTVESNEVSNAPSTAVSGTDNIAAGVNPVDGKLLVTKLEDAGPADDPTKVGMVKYDGKEVANEPEFEEGTMDPLADVAPDGGGRAKRGNLRRKTRQLKVLDENAKN